MNKLAPILCQLIREQQITVSELARRTQIGQPVIHRLISGVTLDPKVSTLSALANYFNISINQLIGDEPLPHTMVLSLTVQVLQQLFSPRMCKAIHCQISQPTHHPRCRVAIGVAQALAQPIPRTA